MRVINLFGGPGTGKSTTAADLFALMKRAGENVELVTEYAKHLVWSERYNTLKEQGYILAKQHHKLSILEDKVDYVVTDSPLILSIIYAKEYNYKHNSTFIPYAWDIIDSYDNENFFLNRIKEYNPVGRMQTEEEARGIDSIISKFLLDNMVDFKEEIADVNAAKNIYEYLKEVE